MAEIEESAIDPQHRVGIEEQWFKANGKVYRRWRWILPDSEWETEEMAFTEIPHVIMERLDKLPWDN